MSRPITGRTIMAGIAGWPVAHSLSPILHNAWLAAAGIDGVYVPFGVPGDGFERFVRGVQGGVVRGLNVTLPFKQQALAMATRASDRARMAQAANVLVFETDGSIVADNTDGLGLLWAFRNQAPGFEVTTGPVVILGAGGGARGAAAAILEAGCRDVRIVNRTVAKAQVIAGELGAGVSAWSLEDVARAFDGAAAVVNATSAGVASESQLKVPLELTPETAVVMDMVYKPLLTPFMAQAEALGRRTVDGLAMLIGQAGPAFEAFYGQPPPAGVDVRALALEALGQ
jgi:shikimate dehydrogenase